MTPPAAPAAPPPGFQPPGHRQAAGRSGFALAARLFGRRSSSGTRWIVLDVETTGLNPHSADLLAIAAIAVRIDGRHRLEIDLADSFEAVLRHDAAGGADKQNILVHGIGVGAMRSGAEPATVLAAFKAWAGDAVRLGFHVGFDRTMIERAERQFLGQETPASWLDLEPIATGLWPAVKARALDEWLAHFEVPCLQRHQAIADTLATAELLLRMWPRLRGQGSVTYEALVKLARSGRWLTR